MKDLNLATFFDHTTISYCATDCDNGRYSLLVGGCSHCCCCRSGFSTTHEPYIVSKCARERWFSVRKFMPIPHEQAPVAGAYFDVRGSDGQLSCQLFEYSRLYWYISTIGTGRAMRSVCHPINGGWIDQAQAMTLIRQVPPELQDQLDVERQQRGLPHEDELPLLQQD